MADHLIQRDEDDSFDYEDLDWIIEQSEYGLYVATATPRMQREIASHYRNADVCVYDYSTDVKPFTYSVPARLFLDNPGKRAYFLLNVQCCLLDEKGQFDDALLNRLNSCRDMFAREKKNVVFFMTEAATRQLNLKAYDLHSYIQLFLKFEDDLPDETDTIEPPDTSTDHSIGVEPPEIDYGEPRNTLLAKAISLSNIAQKYYDDGRYQDAETFWRGTLTIRERLLGEEHSDTAAALYQMGCACERQAHYDEALALLQRALKIQLHTVGKHPDTATTYNSIALVYADTGEYDKALEYHQKALEIFEQTLGKDHPHTKTVCDSLARLRETMTSKYPHNVSTL